MLLGNSELQLGVALCRLFFFKAFLLSPPSVAGRTHIKQLSEGIEVNFCWLAALSGGSVVLGVAGKRLLLDQWEGLFRKSQHWFEKSFCFGGNSCLVYNRIYHTENRRTWSHSLPLLVNRQTSYGSNCHLCMDNNPEH